ncbi:MAG: hypothetical protein B6V02_00300 [Thermoprotei archaeon ex4572_64]|nr:MAG: hypothetical protein B6V02_00300 [Thermoprotei archaeon ex4572_64]
MKCPYCNGIVILDSERGEYVCTGCGVVLEREYEIPIKMSDQASPFEDFSKLDYKSLEMKIRKDAKHEALTRLLMFKKLKIINEKLRARSFSNYTRILNCIRDVCEKLGIERRYARYAEKVFLELVRRGKSLEMTYYKIAAAALIYTILVHNLPISSKDLIKHFKAEGHRVTFGDLVKIIPEIGRISYSTRDRILSYTKYALSKLNFTSDERLRVYKKVILTLRQISKSTLQGKNPKVLAAALIYRASRELGLKLSLTTISQTLGISIVTLREYVKKYVGN